MSNVKILGIDHISNASIRSVRQEITENYYDVVAVEVGPARRKLHRKGKPFRVPTAMGKSMAISQFLMRRSRGNVRESAMWTAVHEAQNQGMDVTFIDKDIRKTLKKLRSETNVLEKIKITSGNLIGGIVVRAASIGPGIIIDEDVDYEDISAEEHVDKLSNSPAVKEVLIDDRNRHMAKEIQMLTSRYEDILVVVGKGHVPGLKEELKRLEVL